MISCFDNYWLGTVDFSASYMCVQFVTHRSWPRIWKCDPFKISNFKVLALTDFFPKADLRGQVDSNNYVVLC